MTQLQSSKLVDPFQGKSIVSFLPRSYRDFKDSLKSNDLEAIHQHMTLMALQNTDKYFEEAKSIIDGGSEILNTKDNYEHNMKENENPRKNRPALPRKRAKFSMMPDTSQPSTIIEPTFQMDQLHDPDDFFAAYEKFENTVKELKRQRGEDPNVPIISTTVRQRRPEIPRRKVSYKHHVYSSQPENDTLFSQETMQDTIESQSQPIHDSHNESLTPNCQSKEKDIAGSIAKDEDQVDKLFDDLMSSNIADLDDNEALSYLKDCLKIKPVAVNDFQFPDYHDIPSTVNILSSVNLMKDTLGKQKITSDKPLTSISSPTPPKSPFLAISTFGKLISKSTESELNDPFSARVSDLFPTTTTSEIISNPSTHANKDKEFSVSASKDKEFSVSASKDRIFSFSASKDNLSELIISMEKHKQGDNMEEMDEGIQGNAEDMVEKTLSPTKDNSNVDEFIDNILCDHDIGENVKDATEKEVSSISPEENVEITFQSAQTNGGSVNVQEATVPVQDPLIVQEQQSEEHPKTSTNNRKKTRANKTNAKKKQHSSAAETSINNLDASVPVQDPNIVPEQQPEELQITSMNNRRNTIGSKIDQKMKRHSLAEAGSSWTAGVRRSKRIKSKPLEYWRGERPLYARVHNSLPTLVGVKFLSPTGKTGFKIKSFVNDEYKDLVDSISLH